MLAPTVHWCGSSQRLAHRQDRPTGSTVGRMRGSLVFGIRGVRIDMVDGSLTVQGLDGRVVEDRATLTADVVSAVDVDFVARTCSLAFIDGGPMVVVDFPATVFAPPPGKVVYLDQNHWINLARAIKSPDKVTPKSELDPALALIEAVRQREITLPLSAAHMVERGRSGSSRQRGDLGQVMAELSRGWFMRNPIAVRRGEFHRMLRLRASNASPPQLPGPVFTCSPAEFFASPSIPGAMLPPFDYTNRPDHGTGLAAQLLRLSTLLAHVSTIVDPSPVYTSEGVARAAGWASDHDRLAQFLGSTDRERWQRQLAIRGKVLADLGDEIAIWALTSGMTVDEFSEWFLVTSEIDLPRMPYMGRVHEVAQLRLANSDDRWEANDLHDLHFLSCAAGYADVVVAEKKHGNYLRRAQPCVNRGATIVTRLQQCLEDLARG